MIVFQFSSIMVTLCNFVDSFNVMNDLDTLLTFFNSYGDNNNRAKNNNDNDSNKQVTA